MRSQVAEGNLRSIWFKIGLILILSDVLYLIYSVSGIPIFDSVHHDASCKIIHVTLSLYIWFAMNDFVIGLYCLFAFILPLRKYIKLANKSNSMHIDVNNNKINDPNLRSIATRIMVYSSIALISTMTVTVITAVIKESASLVLYSHLI